MHITITGRLGSGKSTVAKLLRDKYGFEIYSTGTVQRKMAEELGLSTLEMNEMMKNDVNFDHKIDDAVVKLSRERRDDRLIFDSRMAWHFAEYSFRVFVTIDPRVAGERVFKDNRGAVEQYASAEEAAEGLMTRSMVENARFKDIYRVDNLDYGNYDLIVDSSVADQFAVCELIYREFCAFEKDPAAYGHKMFLAARSVYPTALPADEASGPVAVFPLGGYHYAVSGFGKVAEARRAGEPFLPVDLTGVPADASARIAAVGEDGLAAWEKAGGFTFPAVPAAYRQ